MLIKIAGIQQKITGNFFIGILAIAIFY